MLASDIAPLSPIDCAAGLKVAVRLLACRAILPLAHTIMTVRPQAPGRQDPYSSSRLPGGRWLRGVLIACCLFSSAFAELTIKQDDVVVCYGGSMMDRLLEHGELEAYLQLAHPGKNLKVRSLGWPGDEVGYRLRPDGYAEHLKMLLAQWPASIVVLGFGMNESFAGPAGLKAFETQLETFLHEVARRHPGAKLVMLAPLAFEQKVAPDADARNREIAAYVDVLRAQARAKQALWVDLFSASQAAYRRNSEPLTMYGLHLNERGCREIGRELARALLGDAAVARVDAARLREVAQAAAQKTQRVEALVRIKNAVLYFGQRRRPHEYAAELPRYHQMIDQSDAIIQRLVASPDLKFADIPPPSLPSMLDRSRGSGRSGKDAGDSRRGALEAVIRPPKDQATEISVADGYTLNLFASESEFPELRNPLQIAFDARGRLWVATMPSFPLTEPGLPYPDKVIILEDTDRDGKADKSTVFAEGFDVLDGIAFHERGVIVSAQPRLWILEDTDGDDRADRRTELLRGVDVSDTHHGGMIATDPRGHVIFCDGVFNRSQFETPFGVVRGVDANTYRLNPATGRIDREWQSITPNSWKVAFDRYGNMFQRYGGGPVKDGLVHTWTPIGVYHRGEYGNIQNYAKGPSVTIVSSPNFPDEYQQSLVSGLLLGTYSVTITRTDTATGPHVDAGRIDLMTSKNPVFRPVDIAFGFDGAMYVADFCTVLIGQGPNPTRDPGWDSEHGRIWRLVYNGKPVVKDWPRIEGAGVGELLALLDHPQDLVRFHARLRLRALGASVLPALDRWAAASERSELALLEAAWIFQAQDQVRPRLLERLLASKDPQYRAAAVQQVRFQFEQLPKGREMLAQAAKDSHPRVQMAAINVVSHLRPRHPDIESVLSGLHAHAGLVGEMKATLAAGVTAARSPSIPVLEISPASRVAHWLTEDSPPAEPRPSTKGALQAVNKTFTTFIDARSAQTALLSVRHGFMDVSVNGVQIFSVDHQYSLEHQLVLDLQPGINSVEIAYRRLRGAAPAVHIYDPLGRPLSDAKIPSGTEELNRFAAEWSKVHAADEGALRVQAVPHQMKFAPTELRVTAGEEVRIVFENPDLMLHNLVIIAPGSEEEVGQLADEMAAASDGLAKQYVPASPRVLHATPLINHKERFELRFTAPAAPGNYPFICTFPGHWRMMRGVLVVEASSTSR